MSLFDSLKDIRSKLVSGDNIKTENFVFQLHYVWTVTFLLTFSVLLSLSQYAGDPIDCLVKHAIQKDDLQTFDKYCWVEGTYTRRTELTDDSKVHQMKSDLASVRCFDSKDTKKDPKENCWKHQYYQWVALVLVAQAGCFYLPRYMWQIWEEGKIKSLVSGLDRSTLVRGLQTKDSLSKGELNDKLKQVLHYWREARGTNNIWAVKYYVCEVLNAFNVVLQFYFVNYFLDGQFGRVAKDGLTLEENNSILPILAECRLKMFGAGGGEEIIYGLCVLPLNIVNQKFYTIFWFWLSLLLVVSFAMVTLRAVVVLSAEARDFVLRYIYGIKDFNRSIVTCSSHGDWFFLTCLLDNMNGVVNSYFVVELGKLKEYTAFGDFHDE